MNTDACPCSVPRYGVKAITAVALAPLLLIACTAAAPKPTPKAPTLGEVEAVIDEMLAEEREAVRSRSLSTAQKAPPVAMPEVASGEAFPDAASPPSSRADTFSQDVLRIKGVVPTWNNGTGIALKFLREASGARVSLIYVDETPPIFKESSGRWMIQATAKTKSETLGHFVLFLSDLTPGRYTGSKNEDAVVMSTSMETVWEAEHPDTTWSVNEESWCEIVLEEGSQPEVIEGHFRAKLIDNQGTGFHRIESGYIFIKR